MSCLGFNFQDDMPVIFTHADLEFSNILISRSSDAPPCIVAIIDWHQSGWYVEPWEWVTAYITNMQRSGWVQHDLDTVLKPAEYKYFYSWEYVRMASI